MRLAAAVAVEAQRSEPPRLVAELGGVRLSLSEAEARELAAKLIDAIAALRDSQTTHNRRETTG